MTIALTRADGAAIDPSCPRCANAPPVAPVFLALDLGTETDWALHDRHRTITTGIQLFSPNRFDSGRTAFLRFIHWLSELKEKTGPIDAVFFVEMRRHEDMQAAQIHGGFVAHLLAWAEFAAIPCESVPGIGIADAVTLLHWALLHRAGEL